MSQKILDLEREQFFKEICNGFIEPMEATAVGMYHRLCKCAWDGIFKKLSFEECNQNIKSEMIETQNMF